MNVIWHSHSTHTTAHTHEQMQIWHWIKRKFKSSTALWNYDEKWCLPPKFYGNAFEIRNKYAGNSPLPHGLWWLFCCLGNLLLCNVRLYTLCALLKSRKCEKLYQSRRRKWRKSCNGDNKVLHCIQRVCKTAPICSMCVCVCIWVIYVCNLFGESCQDFEPDKLEK